MSDRYCRWCFTINNYSAEELAACLAMPDVRYLVVGEEVGESGTPHLQGFVVFSKQLRRKAVSLLLPRAWLGAAKGTNEDASKYCKKANKFTEIGELPKERGQAGSDEKKRKYDEARDIAISGGDVIMFDSILGTQYYNTYKRIKQDHTPCPTWVELNSEWRWGESGSGKSRSVRDEYPGAYWKAINKWWCGYAGESVVVIEDIDPTVSQIGPLIAMLKHWTDHYPFRAEMKGGSQMIRPEKIIFTSQYTIEQVFNDRETIVAMNRRCAGRVVQYPITEPPPLVPCSDSTISRAATYHPAPNFPFSDFSK